MDLCGQERWMWACRQDSARPRAARRHACMNMPVHRYAFACLYHVWCPCVSPLQPVWFLDFPGVASAPDLVREICRPGLSELYGDPAETVGSVVPGLPNSTYMMCDTILRAPETLSTSRCGKFLGNLMGCDPALGGSSRPFPVGQPRRPAVCFWFSARRDGDRPGPAPEMCYTHCLHVASWRERFECPAPLVRGEDMLTIFEGRLAGHARGIIPEWPGNNSFAFPGNLNTIYGCRLVAGHGCLRAASGGGGLAAYKVGFVASAAFTKESSWWGGSVWTGRYDRFANHWQIRGAAITGRGGGWTSQWESHRVYHGRNTMVRWQTPQIPTCGTAAAGHAGLRT